MKSTWHHHFEYEEQEGNPTHTHIKQPRELVATFIFLLQPYFDQLGNYVT